MDFGRPVTRRERRGDTPGRIHQRQIKCVTHLRFPYKRLVYPERKALASQRVLSQRRANGTPHDGYVI